MADLRINAPTEVIDRRSRLGFLRRRRLDLQTFRSLHHRDFRYLWLSTIFMTGAMWIQQLTLGWLVYDMTHSPFLLGAVSGMRALPSLFAAPFAGVLTDRVNRRQLMMTTQTVSFVSTLIMAILVATGAVQLWQVFAFGLIGGLAWTFNNPSRQSLVPTLVPKEDLMNAYALTSMAFQSTAVIGPAIAGFLLAWFGTAGNFFLQSSMYLGVIAMVFIMRIPPVQVRQEQVSVRADMAEGFKYVWSDRVVLGLIIIGLIPSLLSMPVQSLMPVFAKDVLDVGSEGLGILLGATGAGALIGAFVLASIGNFRYKGMLMLCALMVTGTAVVIFSQSKWLPLSLVILLMQGAGNIGYRSVNNTMIQAVVPDHLRGRVASIYMLNQSLSPFGSLIAGAMASALGAPAALTVMGASMVVLALAAGIRMPYMRRLT